MLMHVMGEGGDQHRKIARGSDGNRQRRQHQRTRREDGDESTGLHGFRPRSHTGWQGGDHQFCLGPPASLGMEPDLRPVGGQFPALEAADQRQVARKIRGMHHLEP